LLLERGGGEKEDILGERKKEWQEGHLERKLVPNEHAPSPGGGKGKGGKPPIFDKRGGPLTVTSGEWEKPIIDLLRGKKKST